MCALAPNVAIVGNTQAKSGAVIRSISLVIDFSSLPPERDSIRDAVSNSPPPIVDKPATPVGLTLGNEPLARTPREPWLTDTAKSSLIGPLSLAENVSIRAIRISLNVSPFGGFAPRIESPAGNRLLPAGIERRTWPD